MLLDYLDTRYINHRDHSLKDIAQRLGHYEIDTVIEEGAQNCRDRRTIGRSMLLHLDCVGSVYAV